MWQTYAQALFFALACSGMAFGIGKLVVVIGERFIEQRHNALGIRDMLVRRARLEQGLEARHEQRKKELKAVDAEVSETVRRRGMLQRRLTDAISGSERLVHLIGEEMKDLQCFHAEVLNKYVGTAAQTKHAFIDSLWAQPQAVEIWASSLAEARKLVESRCPPAFGYRIVTLRQAGAPPRAADAGKAA